MNAYLPIGQVKSAIPVHSVWCHLHWLLPNIHVFLSNHKTNNSHSIHTIVAAIVMQMKHAISESQLVARL